MGGGVGKHPYKSGGQSGARLWVSALDTELWQKQKEEWGGKTRSKKGGARPPTGMSLSACERKMRESGRVKRQGNGGQDSGILQTSVRGGRKKSGFKEIE